MKQLAPIDFASVTAARRLRVEAVRAQARTSFQTGLLAGQIAFNLAQATDQLVVEFFEELLASRDTKLGQLLREKCAIVAVGGSGRSEICPYSDVDILFLDSGGVGNDFRSLVTAAVQACFDAKLKLSHSVRSPTDAVSFALEDTPFATSLIETRGIWGSKALVDDLKRNFSRKVVERRRRAFVEAAIAGRESEWRDLGGGMLELQPNVKTSPGGLRELHLLRWIGFAHHGETGIDALRLKGALTKDESRQLKETYEFLTRIRIDLHLAGERAQDLLTRDDQLRISNDDGTHAAAHQRPVERFMQTYFQHTRSLASIVKGFVTRHRRPSILNVAKNFVAGHRADGVLRVTPHEIDCRASDLPKLCHTLESILKAYRLASWHNVAVSPLIEVAIRKAVPALTGAALSEDTAKLFVEILTRPQPLGQLIRSMFDNELLDAIIPDVRHARCLLQFNQYHSFCVDEHTLRAVDALTNLRNDPGPIGKTYRAINHPEVVHLAMILHDLGKGLPGDHSVIGEHIAHRIADRLYLPPLQKEQAGFLIRQHLTMADIAFRRDIHDQNQVLAFSHLCGTSENLAMLYVLTVADISAVGPGVWTDWKADLLTEFFDRCMANLSGQHFGQYDEHRRAALTQQVQVALANLPQGAALVESVERRLRDFSASYLMATPADRIASDILAITGLDDESVTVQGQYDAGTGTVEYRAFTKNPLASRGCFYKMCGVLTAKRMEILSAEINTTTGIVADVFRVKDRDFEGDVPVHRIADVGDALRQVLLDKVAVEALFRRHRRFGESRREPVSNLSTRVTLDAETSDRLVIDVFAHDRPGLLYTITKTLFTLGLSIELAKISTHFDQVCDVFYVRELTGEKVAGEVRLTEIQSMLELRLREFEQAGHRAFIEG